MAASGETALLTGATGFVGGACLRELIARGVRVEAVTLHGRGPSHDGVTWHAADLRSPAQCERLVAGLRPTRILHVAWGVEPGVYATSLENLDWLEGGVALAKAFGRHGGRRFVGVGTCAEYDWTEDEFIEDVTPLRPATVYGRSKLALWDSVQACAVGYGFSAAWGRLFLPYGPGDPAKRLIPSVVAAIRAGRPVELSEGTQERDFVYVDDVADLLVNLALGEREGSFNVGTGEANSVRRAIELIASRLGTPSSLLRFGAVPLRAGEPQRLIADMTKVRRELGWSPRTFLDAGLSAYLRAQPSLLAAT